ncbi:MAG: hypothetical protein ACRD03_15625 [Acidimicrobiales bacterium]
MIVVTATLVAALFAWAPAAHAQAAPRGGQTWITITGTCAGEPVSVLEPLGGSTGFVLDGSIVVGKKFTLIDDATGAILHEFTEGQGLSPERLTECVFLLPDYNLPGVGVIDLRLVVMVLRPGW